MNFIHPVAIQKKNKGDIHNWWKGKYLQNENTHLRELKKLHTIWSKIEVKIWGERKHIQYI